ncbi:flagellar assembly protein A [Campylobacter taeniopygiae]|uniref:DUF342 domain-containing protein n=1 Tax=Campylobacter taeniopygiae TaxID=2510188 RepID=A0ABY2TL87_9BACT|nr:flagellar assembly protein A [Campylobacter taeniopygiae]TKX34833.1 DUF342 domain-containing protein [Campylobacter taeniopygiae]
MNKTLQTLDPFESLKFEQENSQEMLDFSIIDYKLICSNKKPAKRKIYEKQDLDLFNSDDFFVKNYDTMIQQFIIEIHPKKPQNNFAVLLKSDAALTHVKVHIKCRENFSYYADLKKDILQSIYKTMAKQRILIIRLEKNFFKMLDDFIKDHENGNGAQELECSLAKGVDKIDNQSDKIIIHRQEINDNSSSQNYDDGKFCKPIKKDELLFEYIFRINGKEGRNLRGAIIGLNPVKFHGNPFNLKDESIYTQELEDRIRYFSNYYGFLNKDRIGYSITNDIKIKQVGLKTTGSIKTDTQEDIKLEIYNHDVSDDAIKSGIVNVKASNIKVNGNIGATEIHAKNLTVKGLTHKKSLIYAQNSSIFIHKGYIKAENVYIKNLGNGTVEAKNVYIENCVGGTIKAENIYICNLLTDNILYPDKKLVISDCIKTKNTIICDFKNNNLECENLKNLGIKVQNTLAIITAKTKNLYNHLINNQVRAIQAKKEKNPLPAQTNFINLYDSKINDYNHLVSLYAKFIKIKFQIDTKINSLEQTQQAANIYIDAQEIGNDNLLLFEAETKKEEIRYTLSSNDSQKNFYIEKKGDKQELRSSHYNEIEIEDLKSNYEELKKVNSF